MIKTFESFNELYAFFVPNLIKPPVKSSSICSGVHLDRAGWHIDIYHRPTDDALSIWLFSHPDRGPKWVVCYDKFTNSSQES